MMRPQVELAAESTAECRKLALRMKRRKTVSVTPAMGARMVAGAMRTLPIWTDCGIAAGSAARPETGVSQYLRMELFYAFQQHMKDKTKILRLVRRGGLAQDDRQEKFAQVQSSLCRNY